MRKSIKNLAIANNEIINDSTKIKGGIAQGGITVIIIELESDVVIEDNVMV
jgi:hypothetical protein